MKKSYQLMPKIKNWALITLIFAMMLSSCAAARSEPQYSSPGAAPKPAASMDAAYEGTGEYAPAAPIEASNSEGVERLVIQNAYISLAVPDPGKSMDAIALLAQEMGGFVVSKNLYQQTLDSGIKVPRASITIRVPAERLNDALARIRQESTQDPINESSDSQDITSEYTDLQSRLRNLENTETQLNRIMEEATKTEDILAVYNQLVQIREQIEVTKGRIQYYEQSAALSAIAVELMADEAVQPLTVGGWQPQGVARNAVQALINTAKFLGNALIWIIIYVLPVMVVLYVVFFLPIRFLWRKLRKPTFSFKRKKNLEPPQQPE